MAVEARADMLDIHVVDGRERWRSRVRGAAAALVVACTVVCDPAHAIDLAPLWDYDHPDVSEQRFRAALADANADDRLILQTQIARTYGLRGDFTQARVALAAIEPRLARAGAEARARYALELGRTYASAAHASAAVSDDDRARARRAYGQALAVARDAHLDALAIDAIHMFAFVDTAPADQLRRDREALAIALRSDQPAAQRWEASIRNNLGAALHDLGRHDEALAEFRWALAQRERSGNVEAAREAWWAVAWELRALRRDDEALAIQHRLEREYDAAGAPSEDVYAELAELYRVRGDVAGADRYAALAARAKAAAAH